MKDINNKTLFGIGFWIGVLVYTIINFILVCTNASVTHIKNYDILILVAASLGVIFNGSIILLILRYNEHDQVLASEDYV